jgi:hypothetical protein
LLRFPPDLDGPKRKGRWSSPAALVHTVGETFQMVI